MKKNVPLGELMHGAIFSQEKMEGLTPQPGTGPASSLQDPRSPKVGAVLLFSARE